MVWRLDRLGWSDRRLVDQLQVLGEQGGGGIRPLQESIDTTSPGRRLVFHCVLRWLSLRGTSSRNAPTPALLRLELVARLMVGHGGCRRIRCGRLDVCMSSRT